MTSIIITGGAGFIGSHVVRLFVNKYPEYRIINVDKLTYAGNLANLKDIEDKPNYRFVIVSLPFTLMPDWDGSGSVTVLLPLSTMFRSESHAMGPAL